MAWDAGFFRDFQVGDPPFLRFYFFPEPTVTVGRLEAGKFHVPWAVERVQVRPTGGRAVFHGRGDLCYSLAASVFDPLVGGGLLESYRRIALFWQRALQRLGRSVALEEKRKVSRRFLKHCFSSPSAFELVWRGKKIAGAAQARRGDVFLQQGVLLLSVDPFWEKCDPQGAFLPRGGLNDEGSAAALRREDLVQAFLRVLKEENVAIEKVFPEKVTSS